MQLLVTVWLLWALLYIRLVWNARPCIDCEGVL